MYSDERLKAMIVQETLTKSSKAISTQGDAHFKGVLNRSQASLHDHRVTVRLAYQAIDTTQIYHPRMRLLPISCFD